jgi:2-polyprenyl-3-methyl-5-hydroxy-6-metoxy-1,4-benzoquinol methylase
LHRRQPTRARVIVDSKRSRQINADSCVCCGQLRWRAYGSNAGFGLLQCRACGFIRLDVAREFDLNALYDEDYFFGRGFDQSRLIPEAREPDPSLVERRAYWLTLLSGEVGGPGRLLDVGCGAGPLLDVARDLGWSAEGQEIAPVAASEARSRGHLVRVGPLEECGYAAGSFDAATMIEVIEHLRDPRPTVAAVLRTLRPGGRLLIATGDIGSLRARVQRTHWSYIRPPGHVSYFTSESLRRLLLNSGFKRVRSMPTYNLAHLSLPGLGRVHSTIMRTVARLLRGLTRMEHCVLAEV